LSELVIGKKVYQVTCERISVFFTLGHVKFLRENEIEGEDHFADVGTIRRILRENEIEGEDHFAAVGTSANNFPRYCQELINDMDIRQEERRKCDIASLPPDPPVSHFP